jgi:hypothetical protein
VVDGWKILKVDVFVVPPMAALIGNTRGPIGLDWKSFVVCCRLLVLLAFDTDIWNPLTIYQLQALG